MADPNATDLGVRFDRALVEAPNGTVRADALAAEIQRFADRVQQEFADLKRRVTALGG